MKVTYEVMRYPLSSSRKDAEFYDEVTCEREVAQALAQALHNAYDSQWWFYIHEKSQVKEVIPNWENAGRFMQDETEPEPVNDPVYDELKELLLVHS